MLFFLLFFIAPAVSRILAGRSGANNAGQVNQVSGRGNVSSAAAPVQNPKAAYAAAKADLPGKLIDLDSELSTAEDFSTDDFETDLDAAELKAARGHLNQAFAAYAANFQGDYVPGMKVSALVASVSDHLDKARRHLLLADPKTAAELHAADEAREAAELAAAKAATEKAAAQAKADAEAQAALEDELNMFGWGHPGYVRPTARRTTVQLTPFGIMIGSF